MFNVEGGGYGAGGREEERGGEKKWTCGKKVGVVRGMYGVDSDWFVGGRGWIRIGSWEVWLRPDSSGETAYEEVLISFHTDARSWTSTGRIAFLSHRRKMKLDYRPITNCDFFLSHRRKKLDYTGRSRTSIHFPFTQTQEARLPADHELRFYCVLEASTEDRQSPRTVSC